MCDCTPKTPGKYCGLPGCRDPEHIKQEHINRAAHEWARRKDESGFDDSRDGPDVLGDVAL